MSGHSKWSKIKRKKESADKKKGQLFSKLSKAIALAAKSGGNPVGNPSLKLELERAKAGGMTQDTIQKAIRKGTGEDKDGASADEVVYEAYGPGGVALLIKAATNNRNRTSSSMKHLLSKYGGKLGGQGSVSYIFAGTGQPAFTINLDDEQKGRLQTLIKALEGDEDVVAIETNANLQST